VKDNRNSEQNPKTLRNSSLRGISSQNCSATKRINQQLKYRSKRKMFMKINSRTSQTKKIKRGNLETNPDTEVHLNQDKKV
jgi:hypothetical protein